MILFHYVLFALVSLIASIVGTICGIGGGVIIKPMLDLFHKFTSNAIIKELVFFDKFFLLIR